MAGIGSAFGALGGGIVGGAVVQLLLDDKQFQAGLAKAETQTKAAGGTFSSFGSAATQALGFIGLGFASMAVAGAQSLMRIEQINAQTEAAIKSTGGAANVSADQVEMLSSQIENLTSIEAESVQEGANLLLTFTHIRNEVGKGNDIFNQATRIMTDMSVALGQDMKSSAIQLGKALNDPIRGISALRRVGVSFSTEQEKQIKNMVKQNDLMGAQKVVLHELKNEFGKSAEALGDTTAGKVQRFHQVWDSFLEDAAAGSVDIGNALIHPIKFMTSLGDSSGKTTEALDRVTEALKGQLITLPEAVDFLARLADGGIISSDAFDTFAASLTTVGTHTSHVTPGIDHMGDAIEGASRKVHRLAHMSGPAFKEFKKDVQSSFAGAVNSISGFDRKWAFSAGRFRHLVDQMRDKAETLRNDIKDFEKLKGIPEGFQAWLLQQGPDAVHAFVKQSKSGRDDIVSDWKGIQGAVDTTKHAMDKILTPIDAVKRGLDKITGRHNIEVHIDYSSSGSAGPAGQTISDYFGHALLDS
jgi:hypothetical protein